MAQQAYNVVFYGELAQGYTRERVKRQLAARFNMNQQQLQHAFCGGIS